MDGLAGASWEGLVLCEHCTARAWPCGTIFEHFGNSLPVPWYDTLHSEFSGLEGLLGRLFAVLQDIGVAWSAFAMPGFPSRAALFRSQARLLLVDSG